MIQFVGTSIFRPQKSVFFRVNENRYTRISTVRYYPCYDYNRNYQERNTRAQNKDKKTTNLTYTRVNYNRYNKYYSKP